MIGRFLQQTASRLRRQRWRKRREAELKRRLAQYQIDLAAMEHMPEAVKQRMKRLIMATALDLAAM
jgi:hypothetical protein